MVTENWRLDVRPPNGVAWVHIEGEVEIVATVTGDDVMVTVTANDESKSGANVHKGAMGVLIRQMLTGREYMWLEETAIMSARALVAANA